LFILIVSWEVRAWETAQTRKRGKQDGPEFLGFEFVEIAAK
jgi:hypothetical protein